MQQNQKAEILKQADNLQFAKEFRSFKGSFEEYCLQEKNLEAMFWIVHSNMDLSNPLTNKAIKSIFEDALKKLDSQR